MRRRSALTEKSLVLRAAYLVRDLRARPTFEALERYAQGDVLDIGGWDFVRTVLKRPAIRFRTWTTVEPDLGLLRAAKDPRHRILCTDGCRLGIRDASVDTVVNVHVLEHVMEPLEMVREIARVLRPGGHAILLVPQTSAMHSAPHHYYNFTRSWIREALASSALEVVDLRPLGGLWTTTASHLLYLFAHALRLPGYSTSEDRRGVLFYVLLPLMAVAAIAGVAVSLLFSLGDLTESATDHLVIARRRSI